MHASSVQVIGDSDTDLAEALYKESTKRANLSKLLCYQLSDACKRKPPPVPKVSLRFVLSLRRRFFLGDKSLRPE
jgi:hypothetical protein